MINKIATSSARMIRKEKKEDKFSASGMRKVTSLLILQLLGEQQENTMKNFIPVNLTTWMKWTDSLRYVNYQSSLKKKQA